MAEVARLHSSSGDEGGASASATSITSSPASNADATTSPEMVAEVIQIPASPIMKSRKSKAVHAAAEQQTREKFTAPRLAELDTHGSDLDSPMNGPSDADSTALRERQGEVNEMAQSGGRRDGGGDASIAESQVQHGLSRPSFPQTRIVRSSP